MQSSDGEPRGNYSARGSTVMEPGWLGGDFAGISETLTGVMSGNL